MLCNPTYGVCTADVRGHGIKICRRQAGRRVVGLAAYHISRRLWSMSVGKRISDSLSVSSLPALIGNEITTSRNEN